MPFVKYIVTLPVDLTKTDDTYRDLSVGLEIRKKQKCSDTDYLKIKIEILDNHRKEKHHRRADYTILHPEGQESNDNSSGQTNKRFKKKIKFVLERSSRSEISEPRDAVREKIKLAKNRVKKLLAPQYRGLKSAPRMHALGANQAHPCANTHSVREDSNTSNPLVSNATAITIGSNLSRSANSDKTSCSSANYIHSLTKEAINNQFNLASISLIRDNSQISDSLNLSHSTGSQHWAHSKASKHTNSALCTNIDSFLKTADRPKQQTSAKRLRYDGVAPLDLILPKSEPNQHFNNEYKKNFTYTLEIINNQNKKEKIKVSHAPGKLPDFKTVPNPMEKSARDRWVGELSFNTDYSSSYEPVKMQQEQEKAFAISYKSHFIKKKQSSQNANIKRRCGVSYVKESESRQLHVEDIFLRLPHLVIQASTSCEVLEEYREFMKGLFNKLFTNEHCEYSLLLTWFESEDESSMREYILYPEKRFEVAGGQ